MKCVQAGRWQTLSKPCFMRITAAEEDDGAQRTGKDGSGSSTAVGEFTTEQHCAVRAHGVDNPMKMA